MTVLSTMAVVGVQLLTLGFLAGNFVVHFRRFRVMEKQLDDARIRQQFYQMNIWLLECFSDVRTVLRLRDTPYEEWGIRGKAAARNVCYRLHVIGVLVLHDHMDEAMLSKTWFYSIPTCYLILQPFLEECRKDIDPRYYSAIDPLVGRIMDRNKGFAGLFDPAMDREDVLRRIREEMGPHWTPDKARSDKDGRLQGSPGVR